MAAALKVLTIASCWAFALGALVAAPPVDAGNYGVSPLDVQFSGQKRSAVITVESGDSRPISLRVRAVRWTQDATGSDQYVETGDLIFFPKRIELAPGGKKIVRIGVNQTGDMPERAYRLFIDELPQPELPGQTGTRLSVLVSIGVPVFITPPGASADVAVREGKLSKSGRLTLDLTNSGASRMRISRITDADGTVLSENIPGRYVFPGISKSFDLATEPVACTSADIPLQLDADGAMTPFRAACAP